MSIDDSNRNLFAEWDRMNTILFRYWSNYEEQGKNLKDPEAMKRHNDKFRREVHFLIRRSADSEFHVFLNKRLDYTKEDERKAGLVTRKHMRELAKFILFDPNFALVYHYRLQKSAIIRASGQTFLVNL